MDETAMREEPSTGPHLLATMNDGDQESFRQLRRASVVAPLVVAALIELSHQFLDPIFLPWVDRLLVVTLVLVCAAIFYHHVFERLGRLQDRLLSQNQELLSLHTASLSVSADLAVDSILETVVNSARSLIGTRYGALSVIEADGQIRHFVTSGMSKESIERIGPPPRGHGLLGVVLEQGQRLRTGDILADDRSVGFPANHPVMHSLLAVPVTCQGPFRGNLYLSEKVDATLFSAEEEETLVRFAHQAAVAIDNAYLHSQVKELGAARERIRISHEMHDGLAQILAYVNTKAQVIREYLRQEKVDVAEDHLEQLAVAARTVYDDVRGQILELRTASPAERGLVESLRDYVDQWSRHTQLEVTTDLPEFLAMAPDVELQLLRIVQESLTNVRKHSGAHRVSISLIPTSQGLELTIEDDGGGFDPDLAVGPAAPHSPRFGLTTMRERAEAIGGLMNLESTPRVGTRVMVTLPLNHNATSAENPR